MADVVIIHAPDKGPAAARLAEAVAGAGYAVAAVEVADPERLAEALNGADADARILIWSRPLVSHALLSGDLPRIRQLRNVIEVSADGITPPSGGDDSRVVLISGWRGQPFHPGWQRINAELKRLCGARKGPAEAVRPTAVPASVRAEQAASPAGSASAGRPARTRLIAGAGAAALLVAAALGGASWLSRRAPPEPARQEVPPAPQPAPSPAARSVPAPLPQPSGAPATPATASAEPESTAPSSSPAPEGGGGQSGSAGPPAAKPATRSSAPQGSVRRDARPAPQGPAKKYSPKYSKVMRQFCERSGRSTPQCRTFLRSVRDSAD